MTKLNVSLPKQNYAAGERLTGTCTWDLGSTNIPSCLKVFLNVKLINCFRQVQTNLLVDEMNHTISAPRGEFEFTFQLPPHPRNFQGRNFQITWEINAALDDSVQDSLEFSIR